MNPAVVMRVLAHLELRILQLKFDFNSTTSLPRRERLNRGICELEQIVQTYLESELV